MSFTTEHSEIVDELLGGGRENAQPLPGSEEVQRGVTRRLHWECYKARRRSQEIEDQTGLDTDAEAEPDVGDSIEGVWDGDAGAAGARGWEFDREVLAEDHRLVRELADGDRRVGVRPEPYGEAVVLWAHDDEIGEKETLARELLGKGDVILAGGSKIHTDVGVPVAHRGESVRQRCGDKELELRFRWWLPLPPPAIREGREQCRDDGGVGDKAERRGLWRMKIGVEAPSAFLELGDELRYALPVLGEARVTAPRTTVNEALAQRALESRQAQVQHARALEREVRVFADLLESVPRAETVHDDAERLEVIPRRRCPPVIRRVPYHRPNANKWYSIDILHHIEGAAILAAVCVLD